jgi:hypothetical protein
MLSKGFSPLLSLFFFDIFLYFYSSLFAYLIWLRLKGYVDVDKMLLNAGQRYIIVIAAHTPEDSRASFKSYWETLGVNFQILLDEKWL